MVAGVSPSTWLCDASLLYCAAVVLAGTASRTAAAGKERGRTGCWPPAAALAALIPFRDNNIVGLVTPAGRQLRRDRRVGLYIQRVQIVRWLRVRTFNLRRGSGSLQVGSAAEATYNIRAPLRIFECEREREKYYPLQARKANLGSAL